MEAPNQKATTEPTIFIVSGGAGALGKHLARIVLSQFPTIRPHVLVIPQVREPSQLPDIIEQVAARGGIIFHTLVNPEMRHALIDLADAHSVAAIDTIGEALERVAHMVGLAPLGLPGIFQGERDAYLERIQAIEYTVDHDDGRNPHELDEADVVLTGVSRVGKTPLSIYLSVLGWKVANVPLVPNIQPPRQLFEIDRRRVIGLVIDVEVLTRHRNWRQHLFAGTAGSIYNDPERLYEELDEARRIFRRGGFGILNVTNKPIEESADQIIAMISRYFEHPLRPRN